MTTPLVTLFIPGVPAPQGSKTAFRNKYTGKAQLAEGGSEVGRAKHKNWRQDVRAAAQGWIDGHQPWTALDGPLGLLVLFTFRRPASYPKGRTKYGAVRTQGDAEWHMVKPDGSKLLRSTEDSLTDVGLIADDARFVTSTHHKAWVENGQPGAWLAVYAAPPINLSQLFPFATV